MTTTDAAASTVASVVPWWEVVVARPEDLSPAQGWLRCADVVSGQLDGVDVTADWRLLVREGLAASYGVDVDEVPAQVGAMLVLGWYADVPALVASVTAAAGHPAPVGPAALAVRPHPDGGWPHGVALLPDAGPAAPDPVAEAADHVRSFLAGYRPGVRIGPHAREAALADSLAAAARTARRAAQGETGEVEALARQSCCLVYAVPGVPECPGCPRLTPSGRAGPARAGRP